MNLFKTSAEKEFKVDIISSDLMEMAQIEWQSIIKGRPYWKSDSVRTINFAKFLCYYTSKKTCLDLNVTINGSERADYISKCIKSMIQKSIRDKVEDACGAGGIILKPSGTYNPAGAIDYVMPGSFAVTEKNSNGDILGIIFIDRQVKGDDYYTRLEYHHFTTSIIDAEENVGRTYTIENKAFKSKGSDSLGRSIRLADVPEWKNIPESITITNVEKPLFGYFKMPYNNKKHPEGLESHDYWQGKVYKIRGADADAPNLLEATGYDIDPMTGAGHVRNPLGLHGYNCRHSHKPWDRSLRNPYVDENGNPKIDIHESQEMYEKQQQQRAMERSIRQTKRQLLMKEQEMNGFPNSPELQKEYDKLSYTLRLKNRKYGEFCAENDLQKQSDRIKVAGFKKEQASKANGRATAYQHSVKVPMEKGNNVGYTKRTKEEFEQAAQQIREEIAQYSDRPSKWSGNVVIDNTLAKEKSRGAKDWSCDISVIDTADNGTIWHEMLHSCSSSYYKPEIYDANEYIEEATVEWLNQQICKEKNIISSYAYEEKTAVLQALNDSFSFGTDMEFAKEIFNVPLPERYLWLEDRVDKYLRQVGASFEDYYDVMGFVKNLKGGRHG